MSTQEISEVSSDVIYIPDPPGLMRTGGLKPIAVRLPLELTNKFEWGPPFFIAAVVVGIPAISGWHLWSLWELNALYADPFNALPPILWMAMAFAVFRRIIIESWRHASNQLVHRGTALRLDRERIEYSRFNQSAVSLPWSQVISVGIGKVSMFPVNDRCGTVLLTVKGTATGVRYAYPFGLMGKASMFPRALAPNEVVVPVFGLSMSRHNVIRVMEGIARQHGIDVHKTQIEVFD